MPAHRPGRPRRRPSPRSASLLLALAALLTTGEAPAQSAADAAIDVVALSAWQGRDVAALELVGMPPDLADGARGGLALTPRRSLLSRKLTPLTLERARADARRLRLLLARSGYPDARIAGRGEDDGEGNVRVTFTVTAGPEVAYGPVEVVGLPPDAAAAGDSARVVLARGERFADRAVRRVARSLDVAMQRSGHARPDVAVAIERAADDRARVRFTCTPGPRFAYRRLRVEGAPDDLAALARRVIDLQPGTPYTPDVAADARRHVRKLGLFRTSRIRSDVSAPDSLDLVADLAPRRMITLSAGVGSFTDNWYVLSAGVTHRNLLGGGRGAAITGEYATHERQTELHTWWPALVSSRSRTDLELRRAVSDEEAYGLVREEVALSTLFEPWRHSSLRVGVTLSEGDLEVRSDDPATELLLADGRQTVWMTRWYRDTTDSPLSPRLGGRWTLEGHLSAPGVLSDAPFVGLRGVATRYLPLAPRQTLALRLDAAWSRPLGDAEGLRPDRRWFAGGVSTMRGYGRHQLGPRDGDGNALGGEARLLAGAELRALVRPPLGLALFVDAGQVWARRADADLADLAVAAGLGVLVETPVGPVRLDLARNLGSTPDDVSDWKLQFAIGHPY